MKIVLILVILAIGGYMFAKYAMTQPPMQGLVQTSTADAPVLVSLARPAVVFEPARDMRLEAAGWRTLTPTGRVADNGSLSAKVWFAVYGNGTGRLVTALAEADTQWEWEAGQHCPYHVIWKSEGFYKDRVLFEQIFVLDAESEPFVDAAAKPGQWSLVCRAKMMPFFRKMQVIGEYREPISPEEARTVDMDAARLRAFEGRARASFEILFPDKEAMKRFGERLQRMEADTLFSRKRLSRWVGQLQHENAQR